MEQNLVCRGCLAVEGKFSYIHEFTTIQAYETLIGCPLLPTDRFPHHLCAFCFRTLHKFSEFKARCLKALEVLHQTQVQGQMVTKEYSDTLTSSCPELKPRYIQSKTVTLDVPSTDSEFSELETKDDLDEFTADFNFAISKEVSHIDAEDIDTPDEDVIEPKHEYNIKKEHCDVFVDNFSSVESIKRNVKKKREYKTPKRDIMVKNVKKIDVRRVTKRKQASRTDAEVITAYANTRGFDIAFLTHAEQLQDIAEKKTKVLLSGQNCSQCGKHFKTLDTLERHKKNYHVLTPDSFMCDICLCVFRNKDTLKSHILGHSVIFRCKMCTYETKHKTILRNHQQFHEGKKYSCNYCAKEFDKSTSYLSHVRLKHATELSWCELCGEFFIGKKGVESHKKLTHHMVDEFPNACKECDKRFKNEAALERHADIKGCNLPSCAQCGDSFPAPSLLKYHLVQRHFAAAAPPWFPCGRCPLRFHNAGARLRHVCGAACTCAQCGDHFPHAQLLASHVQARHHIFKCEECGKQFTTSSYFKQHYSLVHAGKKRSPLRNNLLHGNNKREPRYKKRPTMEPVIRKWRVVGEQGLVVEKHDAKGAVTAPPRDEAGMAAMCEVCGKKFRDIVKLKMHQTFHAADNQFICSHCSKGFKRKVLLQMHMRVHTGERPYKCPECPKAFKTYQAYTRHYLIHSGLRRHVCQICNKTFQTSTVTKMHIKTVHMKIPMPPRVRNRRSSGSKKAT